METVTVITSGKGGVGKSTVTAGLGAALAARGRRVLLIDGDAGLGCLDHMLGISERRVFDIADVVSGAAEPDKAVYASSFSPNLFLLPAPGTEEDVVSPDVMRELVGVLARYYDHVLIDSPAGVGQGFLSAAAAARRALVRTPSVCATPRRRVCACGKRAWRSRGWSSTGSAPPPSAGRGATATWTP